jgi:hypothetical protein
MENELLQSEFLLALHNDWIKQYHSMIFSD